jgi:hypothetical protein
MKIAAPVRSHNVTGIADMRWLLEDQFFLVLLSFSLSLSLSLSLYIYIYIYI